MGSDNCCVSVGKVDQLPELIGAVFGVPSPIPRLSRQVWIGFVRSQLYSKRPRDTSFFILSAKKNILYGKKTALKTTKEGTLKMTA